MWCDTFLLCRACFWLHFTFIVTDNGCKQELFRKNTTQRCGDFFENRRLDLLFPKPAAIPLHLHDND